MLFDDVLRSEAFKSLPHPARSVFTAIAAQCHGYNNGDLSLTATTAAMEYGITRKDLAASIPVLEAAGLINVMRRGHISNGRGVCSLYALTCWPIVPSEKYDVPVKVQQPAPNTWANWIRPDKWKDFVRQVKRRAAGRKQPIPHGGNGPVPTWGLKAQGFDPHVRDGSS